MNYTRALTLAHQVLQPANYVEIGCRFGDSLRLSRAPSIGIDPDFRVKRQIVAPTRLFKMSSDDFFANHDVRSLLSGAIDLSFIDGMHHVEFALRDFMNLEENSSANSVILIDDVLPQQMIHASREQKTQIWTGDVYRLILVLQHYRPDLDIRVYDIEVKGLGLVRNLDPSSTLLRDNYKNIEAGLASGQWAGSTVEEIRGRLCPRPVDGLAHDLQSIQQGRARAP